MDYIKTLLESSTVHGLAHIPSTKKLVRLFWILVVILGFSGAGILIYQSFDDWNKNPVTTTIETLPIAEASFPKVTVCPPRNTLLDLNYHFLTIRNKTLPETTRIKLLEHFADHFQQKDFKNTFESIGKIKEKDSYRNWYTGLTKVPIDIDEKLGYSGKVVSYVKILEKIKTYASAGEITSPYFEENFKTEMFPLNTRYYVYLYNPYYRPQSSNLTIQINYDLVPEVESIVLNGKEVSDPKNKEYKVNVTIARNFLVFYFDRNFPLVNFQRWQNKRFTGFNVKWEPTSEVNIVNDTKSMRSFKNDPFNKLYVKIADIVHKVSDEHENENNLMEVVRLIRANDSNVKNLNDRYKNPYGNLDDVFKDFVKDFGKKLNLIDFMDTSVSLFEEEITTETLKTATKLLIYIIAQQEDYWAKWYNYYWYWLQAKPHSLRRVLSKYA